MRAGPVPDSDVTLELQGLLAGGDYSNNLQL